MCEWASIQPVSLSGSRAERLAGRAAVPAAVAAVVMSISRRVKVDWLVIWQTPVELAATDDTPDQRVH